MTAWDDRVKLVVRVLVTLIVVVAGVYVMVVDSYPDGTLKWASGEIGVVLGYWLR